MLFGNQPFIADATAWAVSQAATLAAEMAQRYAARAARLGEHLDGIAGMRVMPPGAGMFVLIDMSAIDSDDESLALQLLHNAGVCTMPGSSFGDCLRGWIRVSLTASDDRFDLGCERIAAFARQRARS